MKQTGWQKCWVRIVTTLMTLAVMAGIYYLSMENAVQSDQRSGKFAEVLVRILHPDYDQMEPVLIKKELFDEAQLIVRKCAHYTEYLILGFLIRLCLESWLGDRIFCSRVLQRIGFITGVLYACTDEAHQLSIDGRFGTWADILVDSLGVFTGIIIGFLIVRIANSKLINTSPGDRHGVFQEK